MQSMPKGIPTLRAVAMPADTNPDGDIFGGWIMSQMDVAGGTFTSQEVRGRVVTVAVDAMTFHRPMYVGDDVSCYCEVIRRGRTSIVIHIEVWVQRHHSEKVERVTEGNFTFVAIDEQGKPRPI
ncbi:MAG: acyl-CoA thioesterase [Amphritea sp.]